MTATKDEARRVAIHLVESSTDKLAAMRHGGSGTGIPLEDARTLIVGSGLTDANAQAVASVLAGMFLKLADETSWAAARNVLDAEEALIIG